MKKRVRASVAMAVYNGEKYIEEQLNSIMEMLDQNDEIVISYNESRDHTLDVIRKYKKNDDRVHIFFDPGNTVETNFNHAVKNCRGEYIFLADQDDIWIHNKIDKMVSYMQNHRTVGILICDGYNVDEKLNIMNSMFEENHTVRNPLLNFIRGSYLGCQMAFTKDIKEKVWPVSIVDPPLAHDLWLGILGSKYAEVDLYYEKLILHRNHDNNCSLGRKMNLKNKLLNRIIFIREMRKRYRQNLL